MEKVDIVVEGFEPGVRDPAAGLMQVFGIDQATAQVIVQRVPLTVKRGVTLDAAQPFEQALLKLGARVRLVHHGQPPAPPRPQRQDTEVAGSPHSRRAAHIETELMHGAGWQQSSEPEMPRVSLPAFRAVRPNTPAPPDMQGPPSSRSGSAWRPQTPPAPEILRSTAPPRPNTPAPPDMSLPPPPPSPAPSLRDPNERVVLRSEPPPPPSFLTPDPMARAQTSVPPEAPRSIAPAQLFEAPPAPSIELADDLPVASQRSGQWHAVRPPLEFDATSRTTEFAEDLMLPWVGTTRELPRPPEPTRRKPVDRR